jgi:hypothetical protein
VSFKHHDRDPKGWAIEIADVAAGGEFGLFVVNDDQIGRYREERVRKPRKKSWHTWRADWLDICPPDTSRFSSNDWAYWRDLVTSQIDYSQRWRPCVRGLGSRCEKLADRVADRIVDLQ